MGLLYITGALVRGRVSGLMFDHGYLPPGHIIVAGSRIFPTPSAKGLLSTIGALTRGSVLGLMLYHGSPPPGHCIIVVGTGYFFLFLEIVVLRCYRMFPNTFGYGYY